LRVPYLLRVNGSSFPGLVLELANPSDVTSFIEISAELDSGAEYSLFEGRLARLIGLDLFDGEPFEFGLVNGASLEARILPVVVGHDELGRFNLRARFSTSPLRRNILGRDFFDLLMIGFDEHQSEVYLRVMHAENYQTKPNDRGKSGSFDFASIDFMNKPTP
jgi:hypothetical protein